MTQQLDSAAAMDPFGIWRAARDANLEAWSRLMIEVVNSDAYARATGAMLENYMVTSQPVQEVLAKVMTSALTMLNMPSRAEVMTLSTRLTHIETRLDDLDAQLRAITDLLQQGLAPANRRTKAKNTQEAV